MTKTIGSLLAFAATTSIALANGGNGDEKKNNAYQNQGGVSWKPGSGVVFDGGDEFALRLMNQLQVQWGYASNEDAPNANSFDVRRARMMLSGHVFTRDLTYQVWLEGTDDVNTTTGANNGAVKEAWAQWDFMNSDSGHVGLRVGQARSHVGLEFTGDPAGLFFVERSSATETFTGVRSTGAWLHGSHAENKFRWTAGLQNGDVSAGAFGIAEVGEEVANADNELTFVAAVSFDPLGDFMNGGNGEWYRQGNLGDVQETRGTIGAGVMIGNNRNTANSNDVESTLININTAWAFQGGLALQGEVYLRTDDPDVTGGTEEDAEGFYVQGMYALEKSGDSNIQWGLGLRFNQINTDNTVNFLTGSPGLMGAPGDVTEISAVVNAFYHGHACKTQFEYTWQDVGPDAGSDMTNHLFRIQFQLLF